MVKFKMKVLLVLGLSACMTITMILYVSSFSEFSGFDLFYVHRKKLQDLLLVNSDSKVETETNNDSFVWNRLTQNSSSSFNVVKTRNKSKSDLVKIPLSNDIGKFNGRESLSRNSLKSIYSGSKVKNLNNSHGRLMNSPIYSIKPLGENPVSFVNYEKELVNITGGTVKVSSINTLFDNKTVLNYFQLRRDKMLGGCGKVYNSSSTLSLKKEKFEHIIVDEKNKILFCYIPKVACTNWKRMLMLLTGKSNNISYVTNLPSYEIHAKNMFASLQNYSAVDINYFIQNYRKIIFVRNPLERLLSAYRNKLEQHYNSSKYFQARFGKFIVKKFRANPSNISLLKGDDVTFSEFVTYLISSPKNQYNEHWQTMNDLCHPCFLKYDVVGKYDTLLTDSKLVLTMFHVNYSFPALPKPSKTASSLKQYYSQLSSDLIQKLYQIYEMDFRLFNYNMNETLGS